LVKWLNGAGRAGGALTLLTGKWIKIRIKIEIRIKRKKDLRELTGGSRLTHPALP
jgi:hypothetical protein